MATTSQESRSPRGRESSLLHRYSLVIGALVNTVVLVTMILASRVWLRTIARQEVDLYHQPGEKWSEAIIDLKAERDEVGFRKLDEAIRLYQARPVPATHQIEALVHDYIYYLNNPRSLDRQAYRLDHALAALHGAGVSPTTYDDINIAWITVFRGELEHGQKQFEAAARNAQQMNEPSVEACAYHGLFFCALARGSTNEATRLANLAVQRDPDCYRRFWLSAYDPGVKRFTGLYPAFAEASIVFCPQPCAPASKGASR